MEAVRSSPRSLQTTTHNNLTVEETPDDYTQQRQDRETNTPDVLNPTTQDVTPAIISSAADITSPSNAVSTSEIEETTNDNRVNQEVNVEEGSENDAPLQTRETRRTSQGKGKEMATPDLKERTITSTASTSETIDETTSRLTNKMLLLHNAAKDGDWEEAKRLVGDEKSLFSETIPPILDTMLHVAADKGHFKFVQNLVECLSAMQNSACKSSSAADLEIEEDIKDLEIEDINGETALHCAATSGCIKSAEAMLGANKKLLLMTNVNGWVPLLNAATSASDEQRKMVDYLRKQTKNCHDPRLEAQTKRQNELFKIYKEIDLRDKDYQGDKSDQGYIRVWDQVQDRLRQTETKDKRSVFKGSFCERVNWVIPSTTPFSGLLGSRLICAIITAGFYDIALSLIEEYPDLVTEKDEFGVCALEVMAQRWFAFRNYSTIWERMIYKVVALYDTAPTYSGGSSIHDIETNVTDHEVVATPCCTIARKRFENTVSSVLKIFGFFKFLRPLRKVPFVAKILEQKKMQKEALSLVKGMCRRMKEMTDSDLSVFLRKSNTFKVAIESGSVEFVTEWLQAVPDAIWLLSNNNQTMIQIAIEERNEAILNLICGMCKANIKSLVSRRDDEGNTILHFAAKLAPPRKLNSIPGAALQMRLELQWFKKVESIIQQQDRLITNKNRETAQVIFTREHKALVKEGEKWMKSTATSCMLVATLIATVVFAAAISVPGGAYNNSSDNEKGLPIFLHERSFMIFAVADALALFSSITSVIMFLAILTSRYAEEDFLSSLPRKLVIGLAMIFLSLASMMVAFTAALYIILQPKLGNQVYGVVAFAVMPVLVFTFTQVRLLVQIFCSTYGPPCRMSPANRILAGGTMIHRNYYKDRTS